MSIDHKAFIGEPSRWPMWPYLPLKRWRDGELDCGHITVTDTTTVKVDLPGDGEHCRVIHYADVDALLADGWRID